MRTTRISVVFASVALLGMMALPAAAQYPFPTGGTLAVTGTVTAGGTIVVSGGGFKPGSTVKCEVDGEVVATATVTAEGTFFCEITVPSNLAGKRLLIRAIGISPSGEQKIQTFEANVPAVTGSDTRTMLYVALAAVLAGGLLFALGKRRAPVGA